MRNSTNVRDTSQRKLVLDLVRTLTELERRTCRNRLQAYRPYERQRDFHDAGRLHRERLFMAGNQLGKTWAGGFECAMHLTGRYPGWWQGRRYERPVRLWAASVTAESTRDNPQRILLGPPAIREQWGTGTVPGDAIAAISLARNIPDAVDSIVVRHESGGQSSLAFKAYGMGREKWQIGSCATGGECAWAKRIVTAPDDVMARATKEQIVAHNRKVATFCR
jgi:phage terminase large subunit-like protein